MVKAKKNRTFAVITFKSSAIYGTPVDDLCNDLVWIKKKMTS